MLPILCSAEQLQEVLHLPELIVLDTSWHLPGTGKNAREDYAKLHIPGARFLDIDAFSDPHTLLPHMLPPHEQFTRLAGELGLTEQSHLVFYDSTGLFSAARGWWMFLAYGHRRLTILDGGLPAWIQAGLPLESGEPVIAPATYTAYHTLPSHLADRQTVLDALRRPDPAILDARSPSRFSGQEKEPRPGVRSGHMPGAVNLHYASLLDAEKKLLPVAELSQRFRQMNLPTRGDIVVSCGSGVTAAILGLALEVTGHHDWKLYDGSWAEWGSSTDLPVAVEKAA